MAPIAFPEWRIPSAAPIDLGVLAGACPSHLDHSARPDESTADPETGMHSTHSDPAHCSMLPEHRTPIFLADNPSAAADTMHAGRIAAASPLARALAPAATADRPLHPRRIAAEAARMAAFLDAAVPGALMPDAAIRDLVETQLESDTAAHLHDILAGNRIHSWTPRSQTNSSFESWTALAGGPLLNQLRFARSTQLGRGLCVPPRSATQSIVFDTPILQITSTLQHPCLGPPKDFIAVRSYAGVRILSVHPNYNHPINDTNQSEDDSSDNLESYVTSLETPDEFDDFSSYLSNARIGISNSANSSHQYPVVDAVDPVIDMSLSPNALDMCFSRTIPGHAAIVLEGGSILICDARFGNPTPWRTNRPDRNAYIPNHMRRLSCSFGAHPRTLIVSYAKIVETCDLRAPSQNPSILFDHINPSEIITGMSINPFQSFECAIATSHRTAVIDTRFSRSPLLQWSTVNSHETQTFIEYLPSFSSSSPSKLVSSLMTWGRKTSEVLIYTLSQSPPLPPTSRGIQKLQSYVTHPDAIVRDPSATASEHVNWPLQEHQTRLTEHESIAPWPPLIGCQIVPTGHDTMTIMHMNSTGAVFAQAYNTGVTKSTDDESYNDGFSNDADIHMNNCIRELEHNVRNDERINMQQAQPVLPHGTFASHKTIDMRPLASLINRWMQEQIDRDSNNHPHSQPNTALKLPCVITTPHDLFIKDITPMQLRKRWRNDQSVNRLPHLFPSRQHAQDISLLTRQALEHAKERFPEAVSIPSNALAFPWKNSDETDDMAPEGTQNDMIDSLDALRDVLHRKLSKSSATTKQLSTKLFTDDDLALDWLARDIWVTRDTIIPFPTTFEIDSSALSSVPSQSRIFGSSISNADSMSVAHSQSEFMSVGEGPFDARSEISGTMDHSNAALVSNDAMSDASYGRRYAPETDWRSDASGGGYTSRGSSRYQPYDPNHGARTPTQSQRSDTESEWYSVPSPSLSQKSGISVASSSAKSLIHARTPLDRLPMLMRTPLVPETAPSVRTSHNNPFSMGESQDLLASSTNANSDNNDDVVQVPIPGGVATLIDIWDNPDAYYDPHTVIVRLRRRGRNGGIRLALRRRKPTQPTAVPADHSLAEAAAAAAASSTAFLNRQSTRYSIHPGTQSLLVSPSTSRMSVFANTTRTSNVSGIASASQPVLSSSLLQSSQPDLSSQIRRSLVPSFSASISQPPPKKKQRAKGF